MIVDIRWDAAVVEFAVYNDDAKIRTKAQMLTCDLEGVTAIELLERLYMLRAAKVSTDNTVFIDPHEEGG